MSKRIRMPVDPSTERMPQPELRIVEDPQPDGANAASPRSFDEFFAAQSETLYRRMRLVTRDHHEAEEVVQDAFLSLYERWDRIAVIPDPVGYLYRTAFNAWKKRSRRAVLAIRNVFAPDPETDAFAPATTGPQAPDRTEIGAPLDQRSRSTPPSRRGGIRPRPVASAMLEGHPAGTLRAVRPKRMRRMPGR